MENNRSECAVPVEEGGSERGLGAFLRSHLRPLTRVQRVALIGFLLISAIDVLLSTALFFGAGGDFVEANPLLAWATEGFSLFLVTVLAVKAIGAGLLALLTSFANRLCNYAGDTVLLAALSTTTALFLIELVTVGVVPSILTIEMMVPIL